MTPSIREHGMTRDEPGDDNEPPRVHGESLR